MTDETERWRKLADDRLAMLAEIARIDAEPLEAVLAIITGGYRDPDTGTADTSTIYHDSVTALRRELMADAEQWRKAGDAYFEKRRDDAKAAVAYPPSRMAGVFAYALAAVLGVAERELGPQTARHLANVADDILENGDENDANADVRPGVPLPPPSPAEQQEAGQMSIWDAGVPS